MDWVFYVFIIVLSIILFIVYFIFHYDGNKDLNEVFKQIWKKDATIKAFTLENTQTGFRNVFIDEKSGLPYISEQKYPVTKSGILITPNDHGVLVDIDDGFQVLGIANTFKCPDGYYTPNCIAKPICTESDAGKTKPITISQFNQLELYGIASSSNSNKYHPRIRVDCLDENGNYKLKYCQDNELLNENNECTPYDICADKLSGFKHNYPTGDNFQLKENEYYTCINNKSSLNKCPDDLIFSEPNQGCIRNNECYGKGLHQILIDDHNYIQCENDDGRKIHCEQGVKSKNNIISCSVDLCTPKEYKYSDKLIEYTYGKTTCENNTHNTLMCDNSSSNFKYTYKWAEVFDVHLPSIPKQALSKDGKYCVDLEGLSRIDNALFNFTENPNIDLAWSKAMHTAHKFNVKTREYVCKEGEYRWDYDYYEIHPKRSILPEIMDTAAPCQTQLYRNYFQLLSEKQEFTKNKFIEEDIQNQYVFLPNHKTPIIFGISYKTVGITNRYNKLVNWWPIYDPETKTYKFSFIKNDNYQWFVEYTDSQIPLGFILDTNVSKFDDGTIPLLVAGYSKCIDDIGITYLNNFVWWFIATGEIQTMDKHFSDKATIVTERLY